MHADNTIHSIIFQQKEATQIVCFFQFFLITQIKILEKGIYYYVISTFIHDDIYSMDNYSGVFHNIIISMMRYGVDDGIW
mgnify:CR=1 FL=1